MPIDHLGITVPPSEHAKVVDFYLAALKPLGYTKMFTYGEAVGLGVDGMADYWITANPDAPSKSSSHFAFKTSGMFLSRGMVCCQCSVICVADGWLVTRSGGGKCFPRCCRGGRSEG